MKIYDKLYVDFAQLVRLKIGVLSKMYK